MITSNFYECVLIASAIFILSDAHSQKCGRSYSKPSKDGKAVNATEESWPWMVAIIHKEEEFEKREVICFGFLIDDIHILTSAHCYANGKDSVDELTALIGSVNQEEAEEYYVDSFIKHEGHLVDSDLKDDLAILKLTVRVGYRKFNPVCLPGRRMQHLPTEGSTATEVGWGVDFERIKLLMQLSGIEIIPNLDCLFKFQEANSWEWAYPRRMDNKFLCGLVPKEKYTCVGDSGTPLMVLQDDRWYAVGVNTFSYMCGRSGAPEGYTKIYPYLPWIKEHTRTKKRN